MDGVPNQLSAAKQDQDALEISLDIVKFLCFDEIHRDLWKTFLVELHDGFNAPNISGERTSWILTDLQSVVLQSDSTSNNTTSLPIKLIERHSNSVKEIPEVNCILQPLKLNFHTTDRFTLVKGIQKVQYNR